MINAKNKIIIIGGGYAGLRSVEKLAKDKNNEILLLDKNSYHYMQTDVYDFIANENDFAQITVDLYGFSMGFDDNVTFSKQEVTEVDFEKKKVITTVDRFAYDYLIIAVGSRTKFVSSIVGLREYAHGVKALHRAMFFKQKFEMSLFKKINENKNLCKPLNIVIAGAGLSGVEIAAQMASFAKEFYCNNNFICRKLNIVLVNSGKHILPGMDEKLIKASQKHLDDLEIIVKNEQKVIALTEDSVTLSSKEVLLMDFMIFAGGIEPNGLVYALNLDKNERGFIQTRETLQTKQYDEVFAIGDCTTIYNDGAVVPPTADTAEQMAEFCSKNIYALIAGKKLKNHHINSRGILIALGRRYAVGKVFNIYFKGYFAYLIKKIIEKIYIHKLKRYSLKGCTKIFSK